MTIDCPVVWGTPRHELPGGEVTILGSDRAVTPTAHVVRMGETTLLVDCGISIPGRETVLDEVVPQLDAVILTHAHNDHIGGLPDLLAAGFEGPIYAHGATLEIAEALLPDGMRIQRARSAEIRRFKERFAAQKRVVRYGANCSLGESTDVVFALREAGHILGSASVELRSKDSRVIFSGDLGRPGSPILNDFNTTWTSERPVDLVVVETTYGDREHAQEPGDIELELERAIQRALRDGGHILVPSFAIGRTQVLLYHLNTLVEAGRIPFLPVAIDTPLGLKITETHQHFRRLFDREALDKIAKGDDPLDFDHLYAVKKGRESAYLRDIKESMLIIAGSGMCTGGRIVGHLKELLPRPETDVIFVGYQAAGTPGRAIQARAEDAHLGRGSHGPTRWRRSAPAGSRDHPPRHLGPRRSPGVGHLVDGNPRQAKRGPAPRRPEIPSVFCQVALGPLKPAAALKTRQKFLSNERKTSNSFI